MNILILYNQKNTRINQLHWSDNIQPVCQHVFAWMHVCDCVRMCVPVCTGFYANWKIPDCVQLKCFLSGAPAVFPLKSTMLTAAAEEEFFSHNDFHSCWLLWKMLLKLLFLSSWQLLSAAIRAHKQPPVQLTQLFEQTHKTQIGTCSQTLFTGCVSAGWGAERDRHK